jgi:hypothetical protein
LFAAMGAVTPLQVTSRAHLVVSKLVMELPSNLTGRVLRKITLNVPC